MKTPVVRFIGTLAALGMLTDPAVESPILGPSDLLLQPPVAINAWVANFHPWLATKALKTYGPQVGELSIFGVGGNAAGRLAVEDEFIEASLKSIRRQEHHPRVLVTVTNSRKMRMGDRRLLWQWIGNTEKMDRHILDLVKMADRADGLDIDYENLYPGDGPRFSLFALKLAQALHARGKYLSVTVEPNAILYGSINWVDFGTRVDRVRIMAYPFHYQRTSPGAVSPPTIVKRIAERALKDIAPEKLEIALPVYGFDWSLKGVRLVATVKQYQDLIRRPGAQAFRDPETHCARVDYVVKEGRGKWTRLVRHTVWFEDAVSAAYKVQMLRQMGIYQIGLWQLGVGDISKLFELVKMDSLPSQ